MDYLKKFNEKELQEKIKATELQNNKIEMNNLKSFKKFFEGKSKFPNIKVIEHEGFIIKMGRDAKSNDHLLEL